MCTVYLKYYRPLSQRLDRCDRVIHNESRDPFGGNVYYVTMQIKFLTRKFRNGERNFHCDVVHITTKWVSRLTLDCNGVFAIKAYCSPYYILCLCKLVIVNVKETMTNWRMPLTSFDIKLKATLTGKVSTMPGSETISLDKTG